VLNILPLFLIAVEATQLTTLLGVTQRWPTAKWSAIAVNLVAVGVLVASYFGFDPGIVFPMFVWFTMMVVALGMCGTTIYLISRRPV